MAAVEGPSQSHMVFVPVSSLLSGRRRNAIHYNSECLSHAASGFAVATMSANGSRRAWERDSEDVCTVPCSTPALRSRMRFVPVPTAEPAMMLRGICLVQA